jgi:hypothetical protein
MALFGRRLTVHAAGLAQLQNAGDSGGGGGGGSPKGDFDLNNILKLIPADIVAAYLTAKDLGRALPGDSAPFIQRHWLQIDFWTCLVVCAAFRIVMTAPDGPINWRTGVNWSLVLTTVVAFFIWAHAVGSEAPVIPGFSGSFAGFFAVLLGLFAPRLVKAESD